MFARFLVLSGWLICASAVAQQPADAKDESQGPIPNEAPGGPVPLRTTPQTKPATPVSPAAGSEPTPTVGASSVKPAAPARPAAPAATRPTPAVATKSAVPAPPPREASAPAPRAATEPVARGFSSDRLFIPGVATIGGGSAALLVSLFTGIAAHGVYKDLERDCKSNLCPSSDADKLDSGKTLAVVSTVFTVVGVAAVGVGTALLIVAKNRSVAAERAHVRLVPGPTALGLGAHVEF